MVNEFENYAEILWDLLEIHESKCIYPSTCSCGGMSDYETLKKHKDETRLPIPDILSKLLVEYGNTTLKWNVENTKHKNRLITARSIIRGTEYFYYGGFQNRNSVKDNDDFFPAFYPIDSNEKELEYWLQFYILDDLYYGKLILISPDTNGNNHQLYLFDHPNQIVKLTITLEQYLELTNKTLGMYSWQEYVTEGSYILNGDIPDNFHENMSILFPNEDLSIFRPAPKLTDSVFNRFVSRPNKTDYRGVFIMKMEELRTNPDIDFKYYEDEPGFKRDKLPYTANYGVPEVVLRKIKKDYGREIPESMLSFYYQMNGCKVRWEYKKNTDDFWLEGKIYFLELEEVMGGKWNDIYLDWSSLELFKDEDAVYYFKEEEAKEFPEMSELMRHARIFDQQGEMRDYFIDFVDGQEEPDIYKINRTEFYKMDIDFITFIEARIEFVGISGWEYKFIKEGFDDDDKERWITEFKDKVSVILPNADFDKFGI